MPADIPPLKAPEDGKVPGRSSGVLPPLPTGQAEEGGARRPEEARRGSRPPSRRPSGTREDLSDMPPRRVVSRHRRGSGADSKGSGSELEAVQGEDMPLRQKHSRQNSDASHGSGSSRATEDKAKGEDRQEEGKQDEERKAGGGIHRVRRTSRVASETGSERSMTETHGGGGGDAPPSTSRHTPSIPKSIATASPGRQTVRIYTGDATRKLEASRPPKGQAIPTGTYAGDRRQTVYVEQPNKKFLQVKSTNEGGRSLLAFLRRSKAAADDSTGMEMWVPPEDDDDNNGVLKRFVDNFQGFASYVSMCTQGILGGLGLTNLIMTYFHNPFLNRTEFLHYYSPIAMNLNRYYYVLISLALVAVVNKFVRNTMVDWGQFGRRQRAFDVILIILYFAAYVVSVIITPYDDLLTYNWMRIPDYYKMRISQEFADRLYVWNILSIIRMGTVSVAWLMASAEYTPTTLLLYWRFSKPHRLVRPPLTTHASVPLSEEPENPMPSALPIPNPGHG